MDNYDVYIISFSFEITNTGEDATINNLYLELFQEKYLNNEITPVSFVFYPVGVKWGKLVNFNTEKENRFFSQCVLSKNTRNVSFDEFKSMFIKSQDIKNKTISFIIPRNFINGNAGKSFIYETKNPRLFRILKGKVIIQTVKGDQAESEFSYPLHFPLIEPKEIKFIYKSQLQQYLEGEK